jgi:signal transduction histidine kinase
MQNLDKQVSHRLTRHYMVALFMVALLSLFGQMLIQRSLNESSNDAHVVNLAGRQRMLSQKLCKMAILLTNKAQFSEEVAFYENDFNETLNLWVKYHYGLKNGKLGLEKKYFVKNSKAIQKLFNEIEPKFQIIISNADSISKKNYSPNSSHFIIKNMLSNERDFLKIMDKIVFQYDFEAKEKVENVKRIEFILFGFTIITLVLEALLIFIPLVRYVQKVISKIKESKNELQSKNHQLEETNEKLISTQKDLLKATEEKFIMLRKDDNTRSTALIEGQEEERKRLARELHDGIGQMLTGLKLDSEQLKSLPFVNEKQRKSFEEHQKLIDETIEATRTISFNLMPSVLTDFGLSSAIRLLLERTAKNANFKTLFNDFSDNISIPNKFENNLYRITQESLNNIIKHAQAKKVSIMLSNEKDKYISLMVIDDGKGFDMKKSKKSRVGGNGLGNLQTRVRLLNGTFKIESELGKGTSIFVKIPLINDGL